MPSRSVSISSHNHHAYSSSDLPSSTDPSQLDAYVPHPVRLPPLQTLHRSTSLAVACAASSLAHHTSAYTHQLSLPPSSARESCSERLHTCQLYFLADPSCRLH